jgi:hypothetical protein
MRSAVDKSYRPLALAIMGDGQGDALLADDGVLVANEQAIAAPFFPAKAAHGLGGPAVAFERINSRW